MVRFKLSDNDSLKQESGRETKKKMRVHDDAHRLSGHCLICHDFTFLILAMRLLFSK